MNLADFSLELQRLVDDLHRNVPGSKYADFVLRGRQLSKEAMQVHLEEWFAMNPDELDTLHTK